MYLTSIAVALSIMINALLGGAPTETLSYRAALARDGKRRWAVCCAGSSTAWTPIIVTRPFGGGEKSMDASNWMELGLIMAATVAFLVFLEIKIRQREEGE
ncbi:hypothetical protein [Shinella zoogloeoides]|uniref:hypothetical protein n=1 Tax=Shinella zoogloeoides TaxID=352475 RepID=UPI00273DE9A1|nr:hypothetical protein [Shinella zoogloeoides]WLR90987.1 hypothetical protein Q9316_00125 [Shinella zoogloeoides]